MKGIGTLVLAVLAAGSIAAPRGRIAFFNAPEWPTGIGPQDVVLADLDGDGDLDVVTANAEDGSVGSVSVLKNLGGGRFAVPATYATPGSASSLVAADFSGDGRPDVAVTNYQGDAISVLRNDGGGGLAPMASVNAGLWPEGVSAGDIDGDGDLDLVWCNASGSDVSYAKNLGSGSFGPRTQIYTGLTSNHTAVADFDRDGRNDIAGLSYGSWRLIVLSNTGFGFAPPAYYDTYYTASEMVVRDFTGDGWPDVAVACGSFVSFLRNAGNGQFLPMANFPVGESATGIAAGDCDSDGDLDIVAANYLANSVSLLRNDGSGGFSNRSDWGVGNNPEGVALGDLNGDGSLDIVTANAQLTNDTFSVVMGNGEGGFAARREYALAGYGFGVTLADLDRDGNLDVIAPGEAGNAYRLSVFFGEGDGTLAARVDYPIPYWGTEVAAADFTNDGWVDVVVSQFSPGNRVLLFRNNGAGGLLPASSHGVHSNAVGLAAADFNGDGWLDLAVANASQLANTVSVLMNNGAGTFLPEFRIAVGTRPVDVAAVDVDQDKDPDLVVAHAVSSFVTLLRNTGGGFARTDIPVGSAQVALSAGDLTGDGMPEVVFGEVLYTYGRIGVLRNLGGSLAPPQWVEVQGAGDVVLRDLDRDGDLDVAFTSSYDTAGALRNDRGLGFDSLTKWRVGYDHARIAAGDLNGDGHPEIVSANNRGRSLSILRNLPSLLEWTLPKEK